MHIYIYFGEQIPVVRPGVHCQPHNHAVSAPVCQGEIEMEYDQRI